MPFNFDLTSGALNISIRSPDGTAELSRPSPHCLLKTSPSSLVPSLGVTGCRHHDHEHSEVTTMDAGLPPTFVADFHNAEHIPKVPYRRLGQTDLIVSRLSFGGAHMSAGVQFDGERPVSGFEEAEATLVEALKRGINYIDTAPYYGAGNSELVLGHVLKNVPRKAFYIATKVSRTAECDFDFSAAKTEEMVNESLRKLAVDYIDVIQVHDCEFADSVDIIINETLPTLDRLRRNGKVRFIGITGYPLFVLTDLINRSSVKIDTVLSYCRSTLFDDELRLFAHFFRNTKSLGIINAAVHGMGLLTPTPLPVWHPAKQETRDACAAAVQWTTGHGLDIGRLALGRALQDKSADTVLVGMRERNILAKNWDVLVNGLTEEEDRQTDLLIEKFMKPLQVNEWEGVELDAYRKDKREFQNNIRRLNGKPSV